MLDLLSACQSSKNLLTSFPEYHHLRTIILRMRYTTFSAKHKLFTVTQRTKGDSEACGKYVAVLSENSSTETDDEKRWTDINAELKCLRKYHTRQFGAYESDIDGSQMYPDSKEAERLIHCCKDLIKMEPDTHDIRRIKRSLKTLETIEENFTRRKSIIESLPSINSIPHSRTPVLIASYGHCSCACSEDVIENDYLSWFEKDCYWKGSAGYLYWLCKEGRDLKDPERRVSANGSEAKKMSLMYENIVRWYECKPIDRQIAYT
ncbi:hypothetical protein HK097_010053 [Rhizophlyctis rosea]|uniref:Uncharacterized protein n=1 Tax=Rhizophlyctis rosea TaxID=64517 RepID=A0AAD5SG06_9FUNG|nr:hypothetical protein HK097_010053 [Rhizophlyctis rosea]